MSWMFSRTKRWSLAKQSSARFHRHFNVWGDRMSPPLCCLSLSERLQGGLSPRLVTQNFFASSSALHYSALLYCALHNFTLLSPPLFNLAQLLPSLFSSPLHCSNLRYSSLFSSTLHFTALLSTQL